MREVGSDGQAQSLAAETNLDSTQRRAIFTSWPVKTANEWAEELDISAEIIREIRRAELHACVATGSVA